MVWWLLALLAGGAALISAESSGGQEGKLFPIQAFPNMEKVAARMSAKGYAWSENSEKFRDPRIPNCWGVAGGGAYTLNGYKFPTDTNNYLGINVLGNELSYLGLSGPTAKGRIAELKKRVNSLSSSSDAEIKPLLYTSQNGLEALSISLYNDIKKDPKRVAERFGIPVSDIEGKEAALEALVNNFTRKYAHVDVTSLFAGVKDELSKLLQRAVKDFVSEFASKGKSTLSALPDLAGAYSALLPLAKEAWDQWNKYQADKASAYAELNKDWLNYWVMAPFEEARNKSLPYPLHVLEAWGNLPPNSSGTLDSKWPGPSDMQYGASNDYIYSLLMFEDLSFEQKRNISEWWSSALTLMADKDVKEVFNALGRNKGLFGNDEQVLLVAAPIAVLNGFDVYEFATLLWGFAKGWASEPGQWVGNYTIKTNDKYAPTKYSVNVGTGMTGKSECAMSTCTNSWVLNWADLCKTALDLAESLDGIKLQKKLEIKADISALDLKPL